LLWDGCEVNAAEVGRAVYMEDPFNLQRFVDAQISTYATALSELKSGAKRSHWIWFIFPQVDGLGFSAMSKRYAINGLDEARAYLAHPVLEPRLRECGEAVLMVDGKTATQIMGSPDDMKLHSSMTLFAHVSDEGTVFHQVLDKYFDGVADEATLRRIE